MKINKTSICLILAFGCTDYEIKNIETTTEQEEDVEEGLQPVGGSNGNNSQQPPQEEPNQEPAETPQEPPQEEPPTDTATEEEIEEEIEEPIVEEEDCTEEFVGFDIEQVSTLQDAVEHSDAHWSHDAVVIHFDDTVLYPNQTWRVSAVEILVLIPDSEFATFVDGQLIHIMVIDANDPQYTTPWTFTLPVVRSQLTWSDYVLPSDAYYSGPLGQFNHKGAWLRFDTTSTIPVSGMTSSDFIVATFWEPYSAVQVGYSNFNQDCSKNWTIYGSNWDLNSQNTNYNACSWPMFRVEFETKMEGDWQKWIQDSFRERTMHALRVRR